MTEEELQRMVDQAQERVDRQQQMQLRRMEAERSKLNVPDTIRQQLSQIEAQIREIPISIPSPESVRPDIRTIAVVASLASLLGGLVGYALGRVLP